MAAACILTLTGPAAADDTLIDASIPTPSFVLCGTTLSLQADSYGALYTGLQPGSERQSGVTAAALLQTQIDYPMDDSWSLGLKGAFLVHHDRLSGDNYGDDLVEMAYLYLQTDFGRIEAGQVQGAAYSLETTGPLVAGPPAIDDGNVTFFVDPHTRQALVNIFAVRTGVFATANDAKLSYYSPRGGDLQFGISFTPSETKGIPFASHAPRLQGDQRSIVEAGGNYSRAIGGLKIAFYAGAAAGQLDKRIAGRAGAFDWAAGSELDYDLPFASLAVGGAYRQSRGYTFDVDQSFSHGNTHAIHATFRVTRGACQAGFEYSSGIADGSQLLPRLEERGFEPSVGCAVTGNLEVVAGHQHIAFARSNGTFDNGRRDVSLDADFLYFEFKL